MVSKDVRKFRIGMALVFADYVLAFVTIDLLFQPTWVEDILNLYIPPNIYTSTSEFLALVAGWISSENLLSGRKNQLACNVIRDANKIWYGIGVYTVMELFFMAGLSPFLTVYELFANPSRTARFLAAFYTYIHVGESNLWPLLRPCIHDGVLAPTRDQRLRYSDWLYVWAKDRVLMSTRMADLVDNFHHILDEFDVSNTTVCRDTVNKLYDVFEPTLLEPALQPHSPFGALIFGPAMWLSMGGLHPNTDPLTALYTEHDLLGASTKLAQGLYTGQLFLPAVDLKCARRDTFTYSGPKEMWSITRHFPSTLHWSSNSKTQARLTKSKVNQITGTLCQSMLFKSIVQDTQGVSIGPLEYCGNGHIVHLGNIPHLAVCKGDPTIPQYHEERTLRGLNRVSTKLEATGKRKRGRTAKENTALNTKLGSLEAGYIRAGTLRGGENEASEDSAPPRAKKRRLSADQRLALMSI
ncbi:hypothetical protein C8F04DRAFT_1255922 [Mycena alexandri]|uniref:Uncharacterized protein n=1 Tax=Mycena alexandri TaxID=1745969 RepID=A0AAD6T791_9AGAR|nr:hypothetical protein C8F04DRAFT_1255922 [Mycena alexandri]